MENEASLVDNAGAEGGSKESTLSKSRSDFILVLFAVVVETSVVGADSVVVGFLGVSFAVGEYLLIIAGIALDTDLFGCKVSNFAWTWTPVRPGMYIERYAKTLAFNCSSSAIRVSKRAMRRSNSRGDHGVSLGISKCPGGAYQ